MEADDRQSSMARLRASSSGTGDAAVHAHRHVGGSVTSERWGGRLTGRPLPSHDPEIEALSDAQREQLVDTWLGRAASERRVADAFSVVHAALCARGAGGALTGLAVRAVDDEHRHAELSRVVASRFAGRALDPPPRLTLVVPAHPGASPALTLSLHVLGHCAMNETFASAFLEATLAGTRGALAKVAVRELLSDEIDHARIGWAYLAAMSQDERAELADWLPHLVSANLRMWRSAPRPYPTDPVLHRHGAPSASAVEDALCAAIRDLILPGLERYALPTAALRAWLARGAPT
jgi:hypothetical protein